MRGGERVREKKTYLHSTKAEENEENKRESISYSRVAIRLLSTAEITDAEKK